MQYHVGDDGHVTEQEARGTRKRGSRQHPDFAGLRLSSAMPALTLLRRYLVGEYKALGGEQDVTQALAMEAVV
jgi:hypothetical protein